MIKNLNRIIKNLVILNKIYNKFNNKYKNNRKSIK